METITSNKIIRLSTKRGVVLRIHVIFYFNKKGRDFMYVRQLEANGTITTGPYFFMEVKRSKGNITCRYVNDIELAYELWSEIIERLSLEKKMTDI